MLPPAHDIPTEPRRARAARATDGEPELVRAGSVPVVQVLLPTPGQLPDDELTSAYPWPDTSVRPWVRACMVLTANGALAGPDGLSRSISGPADRAVLSATRAWADAILVGAGTVRTEKYQPVRERIGAQRLAAGRLAAPRLVILTRSGNLDWDDPLFCDSAVPPLIVATADCQQLPGHVEQIRSPGPEVDLGALVSQLWDLRLERITCEGGPSLLADMIGAGTIDEMDVTIAPHLVGPTGRPTGSPQNPGSSSPAPVTRAPALTGLTIAGLACKDDYIFARYLRRS